jgi:hypothetical protein
VYAGQSQGNDVVTRHHMLPAKYQFELIHISQDFFEMLQFSKNYILATRDRSNLNFKLGFDGIDIDIRVMVADNVSVPEKDNATDVQNMYELVTQLTVDGWCAVDLDKAAQVDIITQVKSGVLVDGKIPSS